MKPFPFASVLAGAALAGLFLAGCSREDRRERLLQSAATHFEAGDYESARIEYQNILQLDSRNAVALERLGRVWIERGAPLRALPYLLQARAVNPDDRELHLRTLQIALGTGKLSEARRGALALLAQHPEDGETLVLLSETVRGPDERNEFKQRLREYAYRRDAAYHLASANIAVQEANFAAAKTNLLRAVALEPRAPSVHAALAAFYLAQNDPTQAGKELRQAAEGAPLRSPHRLAWLEFTARHGAMTEAVAGLTDLVNRAPDCLPAWRALAEIAAREKNATEAQRCLDKIFECDPANYEARLLRAQLAAARGDAAAARDELERMIADYPGLAAPRYALAQLLLQARDEARAIDQLKQALAQNPDHEQAMLLLAALQIHDGDPQAAVLALVDLLFRQPALDAAQMLLADALGALGRLDDLVRLLHAGIEAAPRNPRSQWLLGLVLVRQGDLAGARGCFERALELAPDAPQLVAELVRLDLAEKNFAGAQHRLREQLARHPDSAALHLLEANLYAAQGRWEDAESVATSALVATAQNKEACELLARCFSAQLGKPRTLERMEALLAKIPASAAAWNMAGNVYLQAGRFAQARDAYERHLSLQGETAPVLNNLAFLYNEHLDNSERALELACRARELDPKSSEIADTLGWVLFKRRDYARALPLLQESAAKRPHDAAVQSHLQLALQMGMTASGR